MPTSVTRISEPHLSRGSDLLIANGRRRRRFRGSDLPIANGRRFAITVWLPQQRFAIGRSLPQQSGFTLLELLVVVVMVGILTGTVILGFTGADTEQRLRGSADQLAYTIEMARQYALQRNREWGLYVEPDSLRFVEFDPEQRDWIERNERPFGSTELVDNVALRVEVEKSDKLPNQNQDDLPKVILFSSGEVTPFTLFLEPGWNAPAWEVSSDGISRVRAKQGAW